MKTQHSLFAPATKEDGYRFLRKGEIIEDADEAWDPFEKKWASVAVTAGMEVDESSVGSFRRAAK